MVIVIGWQVYDIARQTMGLKEAAFRLGLIGLVQFVPLFLLTLVTGWTADRVDRRWIARAVGRARAAAARCARCSSRLARITTPADPLTASPRCSASRAPSPGPALGALAPEPRPARDPAARDRAVARSPGRAGAIAGPALGGYPLCRRAPTRPMPRARSCSPSRLACLFAIAPVAADRDRSRASPWAADGRRPRYVRRNRLVLGAISLDLFAVLLGGATAMLPVFARDMLHAGPEGLGPSARRARGRRDADRRLLLVRPLKHNVGVKMLAAVGVFGAATIVFGSVALDAAVARHASRCSARPTCSRSTSASR